MRTTSRCRLESEGGSLLIVVLALIMASLYLAVLVVDLTRIDRINRILQRSADAASLAGSVDLVLTSESDITRWTSAKRAALATLRKNLVISGYTFPDIHSAGTHQGDNDPCEPENDYKPVVYDNGQYRIVIERGLYNDEDPPLFSSMENADTCRAEEVPSANAVRVQLFAYSPRLSLGAFIGRPRFQNMMVSAIGAHVSSRTSP